MASDHPFIQPCSKKYLMGYLISCRFHYGQIFLQKSICTYCEEIFHWKCLIHKVHKTDFRQCWKLSAARKKNKLSPTFEGDFLMFSWAKLKSIYYSVRTKKLLDIKGTFFFLSKSFTNNFSKAIPQVLNPECKSRETLMQVLLSFFVVLPFCVFAQWATVHHYCLESSF